MWRVAAVSGKAHPHPKCPLRKTATVLEIWCKWSSRWTTPCVRPTSTASPSKWVTMWLWDPLDMPQVITIQSSASKSTEFLQGWHKLVRMPSENRLRCLLEDNWSLLALENCFQVHTSWVSRWTMTSCVNVAPTQLAPRSLLSSSRWPLTTQWTRCSSRQVGNPRWCLLTPWPWTTTSII